MATAEIYVRVRVEEGASRFRVQQRLSGIGGYIGSYVVENEKVGDGDFDPFDIAVGYNVNEERVGACRVQERLVRPDCAGRGRGLSGLGTCSRHTSAASRRGRDGRQQAEWMDNERRHRVRWTPLSRPKKCRP